MHHCPVSCQPILTFDILAACRIFLFFFILFLFPYSVDLYTTHLMQVEEPVRVCVSVYVSGCECMCVHMSEREWVNW